MPTHIIVKRGSDRIEDDPVYRLISLGIHFDDMRYDFDHRFYVMTYCTNIPDKLPEGIEIMEKEPGSFTTI